MKLIVLSHPDFMKDELVALHLLLENGLEYLHLRKPNADSASYRHLLKAIDGKYHKHIIIHNHFELLNEFEVKGIHLNSNYQQALPQWHTQQSRSCHNIEEIIKYKDSFDYLFLSPVFNSLSKQDYASAFTDACLKEASGNHIIDSKVIALGGIDHTNIHLLNQWHFGGAAILGYLWEDFQKTQNLTSLSERFSLIKHIINILWYESH